MNRLEKIHSLKVIKESLQGLRSIMFLEKIQDKDVYLTWNGLEISEQIRTLFFKDAIIIGNVSPQPPPDDWIKIPE